jgi:type IV secretory pathway ATPase VirB11/archaellum biosynthesis ATPase
VSFHLILPFFPDELRELLLDPSISDLMINGTTGVYADRGGVVQHIPLSTPYTSDRLQAAIERVARLLGQDLTSQNPFNRWFTTDELIESGSPLTGTRNRASISPAPNGTSASHSADVASMHPSSKRVTTSWLKASFGTPSMRARRPTQSSSPTAFGLPTSRS